MTRRLRSAEQRLWAEADTRAWNLDENGAISHLSESSDLPQEILRDPGMNSCDSFYSKELTSIKKSKELARRRCALADVYEKGSEKSGLMAQAKEALKSPVLEASLSTLQTLYLGARNKELYRTSLEDIVKFLKTGK
ncbi:hypothetical protein HJG60_010338 [Phyllostomus discolor]|uniref:Uncharacterized protein n=1 Tax=Phyllostomus discolor TaxID=89673 RepID=A0A834B1Q3_9CHIR|nr:hypothetical protein HJG60_010338 [Phyllostomus discolor]